MPILVSSPARVPLNGYKIHSQDIAAWLAGSPDGKAVYWTANGHTDSTADVDTLLSANVHGIAVGNVHIERQGRWPFRRWRVHVESNDANEAERIARQLAPRRGLALWQPTACRLTRRPKVRKPWSRGDWLAVAGIVVAVVLALIQAVVGR